MRFIQAFNLGFIDLFFEGLEILGLEIEIATLE